MPDQWYIYPVDNWPHGVRHIAVSVPAPPLPSGEVAVAEMAEVVHDAHPESVAQTTDSETLINVDSTLTVHRPRWWLAVRFLLTVPRRRQ
jgi:hypothetical protein